MTLHFDIRLLLAAAIAACGPMHSARAAAGLTGGNAFGPPGATVAFPIRFDSDVPVVAVQFDVVFDETRLTSEPGAAGGAAADHVATSASTSAGVRRVILYSASNAALKNGTLVNIPFRIAPATPEGTLTVSLTNVLLANAGANSVTPVSLTAGHFSITTAMPALLEPLERNPDGTVQFTFTGTSGRTYITEASTDLISWTPISTNQLSGTLTNITDTAAGGLTRRFYRARLGDLP